MSGTRIFSRAVAATILIAAFWPKGVARAETGYDAWLRYAPLDKQERAKYDSLPTRVVLLRDSVLLHTSGTELIRGMRGMLGRTLHETTGLPSENAIVLGTFEDVHSAAPQLKAPQTLRPDGYWIGSGQVHGHVCIVIAGADDRGVLYGTFALLREIAIGEDATNLHETQEPSAPVRWVDQWDNLDGRIERGYGGQSIFFAGGSVRADLTRVSDYGRLLASAGINGCVVNNVNANPKMLAADFLPQLARIAEAFRPWGVRLAISVDFSTPKALGELGTFDPLDPQVAKWWQAKAGEIYHWIPDFGGFLVKADSEGRPGPSTYGRSPADAANMLASALKPHGGIVFYRAFVYNSHLDWQNPKDDRAKESYRIFHPLDGKFAGNVIVQIKNGPIDFQVREPASPLFGGLEKTNQAIELQITQEYTGQQRHLAFLVPMWKATLDFDMHVEGRATPVKSIVSGESFHRALGGFAGVANVGLDANWLGNPMAMANLYGFGRLAWNPDLGAADIIDEWTKLTFGDNPLVDRTMDDIQLSSWRTYENYTGPLGIGTLTNILGSHYGPGVGSSERNGWGQWHRADHEGVGMDRTVATGTGYVEQYSPEVQKHFETLEAMPDDLLLFFHHVPYTHKLHSGETVIQHIYDSHYAGAQAVQEYARQWKSLRGLIDEERYAFVLARLEYQEGHAIVWRDAVCNWFLRASGIPDEKGRVGRYPDRIEAEAMQLTGYARKDVSPAEDASGGKAIVCETPGQTCAASFRFRGSAGTYRVNVQYFDQNSGRSKFRLLVSGQPVDEWTADDDLPSAGLDGDTSTRRQVSGVALRPEDEIRIEAARDGGEMAAVDYIEILSD